jgi:transposase
MSYNYGWAPPGVTPIIERPLRGKSVTLIGAIANNGPRALRRVEGTVNGEEFPWFLKDSLGPTLNQGDIVVMDGPRVHRVKGVKEALAEFGPTALYLPAYSPELNPIEMTWSWIKAKIRKAAPRKVGRLREAIAAAWNAVTQELCRSWIGHSNYRTIGST